MNWQSLVVSIEVRTSCLNAGEGLDRHAVCHVSNADVEPIPINEALPDSFSVNIIPPRRVWNELLTVVELVAIVVLLSVETVG